MSAPIRVEIQIDCCWWQCQICGRTSWVLDYPAELASASDTGRAHLAAHHAAQMPPVAHGDPDALKVAPRPLTWTPDVQCDFPCCCDHDHCRAHSNPINTAHNLSRGDC